MHVTYPTDEQRRHPAFCKVAARRWPMIPFHNGQYTYRVRETSGTIRTVHVPCTACRQTATD